MKKEDIKLKLRESLLGGIFEKTKNTPEPKSSEKKDDGEDSEGESKEEKEKLNTKTVEIQQAVGPGKQLKISQVMDAAGVGDADNAADRSKFRQKIFNKNDRHLTAKEASALSKVIKNSGAYD